MPRTDVLFVVLICFALMGCADDEQIPLPEGYWSLKQADEILDKTIVIRLDPDLSALSEAEQQAVTMLLEAGAIIQRLYETSLHHEGPAALRELRNLHEHLGQPAHTGKLLDLHRLFHGPIATTLDNRREPFLPVSSELPGRNFYPVDTTRDDIDAYLAAGQSDPDLLGLRTVVRRTTAEMLRRDLDTLILYPTLATLHPGLQQRLLDLDNGALPAAFYSVPYSVAYAEDIYALYGLFNSIADVMKATDSDFADYLRLRARDLISDDYEGSNAAWVRGRFDNLNAEIGSYETYDDKLFGVKSSMALSILVRDRERTEALLKAVDDLQGLEDALPYAGHKRVQKDIPVGVYNVVADFGQARGTNTATILPNDASHSRKYGRTILLRYNIMSQPDLFSERLAKFRAATTAAHEDDLTLDGSFERTLWHEIGHYLGPGQTRDGRELNLALGEFSDLFEELKSDLVSLYSAKALAASGYHDKVNLRAHYADGIRRVLQIVRPRPEQPYQTMQLMQMNFFLKQGLLTLDSDEESLAIDYSRYHDVVGDLLKRVLDVQLAGDRDAAAAFVDRYSAWDEHIHEMLARRLRDTAKFRYRLLRYAALAE